MDAFTLGGKEAPVKIGVPARTRSFFERRKFTLLPVLAVCLSATTLGVYQVAPRFEAELRLYITRARAQTQLSPDLAPPPVSNSAVSEGEISSAIELLRSRELMERTMVMCGVADRSSRVAYAAALSAFSRDLQVGPVGKTSLISVRYANSDPRTAANVPNTIAALYLEKHLRINGSRQSSEFFTEQAGTYGTELRTAQDRLAAFEQRNQASLLNEQKHANLKRLAELDSSLQDTRLQIRDARERATSFRRQFSALPATVNSASRLARNFSLIERWKTQLLDLELKRSELLARYDPGYRLVKQIEDQIAETRAALNKELTESIVDKTDAINPLRQSVESDLMKAEALIAGLSAREGALVVDMEASRRRQQGLSALTVEHDNLERMVKMAEENYLLYDKKRVEARISEAMDREGLLNVSIVEPATAPLVPATRQRMFLAVLGVMLSLFVSLGAGLIVDAFDPPVRGKADLEQAAGVPVVIDLERGSAGQPWS